MTVAESPHRPHCYRCDKPVLSCLCAHIARVQNRTPIVIVQHKHESRHPFGTVRIAELGLANARVHTVAGWSNSGDLPPAWLPPGAGLLYPGEGAVDLALMAPNERPSALVLLDGTWHQARALLRDHAWLRGLPRYAFTPTSPSRYRIRREPFPQYVSTIEAIVQALALVEPELADAGSLLTAFERLVDVQLELQSQRERSLRSCERRPRAVRCLPRALVENFEGLVLVYGEASRLERGETKAPELVHWTALRLRDLATFDRVVGPTQELPSSTRLAQLELSLADFEGGVSTAALAREWRDFCAVGAPPAGQCTPASGEWLAVWNPRTLAHFARSTGVVLAGVGLKGVYGRVRGQDTLLDQSSELDHQPSLPAHFRQALAAVRGRAQRRLANALSCALGLHRLSLGAEG